MCCFCAHEYRLNTWARISEATLAKLQGYIRLAYKEMFLCCARPIVPQAEEKTSPLLVWVELSISLVWDKICISWDACDNVRSSWFSQISYLFCWVIDDALWWQWADYIFLWQSDIARTYTLDWGDWLYQIALYAELFPNTLVRGQICDSAQVWCWMHKVW